MARSQKFSFSNPLRKSTVPSTHATTEPSAVRDNGGMQDGGSKAQKILGTSKSKSSRGGRDDTKKPSKGLNGKPSLISITVSEIESEPIDASLSPAVPTEPRDTPNLRTRPSSPLLGQTFVKGSVIAGSMTDSKAGRLREHGSSSTLHSYYDPQKSPLAISQQTSASSARDFALRKGCPPVNPPQTHLAPSSPLRHEPMDLDETMLESASRKRPTRIDLSMLFPKPRSSSTPMLSPHRLTNSPSPLSTDSNEIPSKGPRLSAAHKPKKLTKTPKKMATEPARPLRHVPERIDSGRDLGFAKNHTIKQRVGIQNWFDGVEGEISDDDGTVEPEFKPKYVARSEMGGSTPGISNRDSYFSPIATVVQEAQDNHVASKASTPNAAPAEKLAQFRSTLQSLGSESNLSLPSKMYSTISKESASSTLDGSNLQEQSVLQLSSSDSEGEGEGEEEEVNSMPLLRASLASAYIDSDYELCTAKSVKAASRPSMTDVRSFANDRNSKPITQLRPRQPTPVELRVPDRRSSRVSSQVSDNRSSMATSDRERSFIGPEEPAGFFIGSDRSSYSNRQSYASSQSNLSRRRSRIMHVTRQEEMLLENIRQKRANMRQSILAEVYRSEIEEDPVSLHRPRTSGAGIGDSERSFLRLSQQSFLAQRPSSAEDIGNVDPELSGMAVSRIEQGAFGHSPRTSLVLSSADGALPSPSTSQSRGSPVTPTILPATVNPLPSNRGSVVNFSPNGHHRYSHIRGRTNSSHVIMLDSFDDPKNQVRLHGEEEFPLWAYKECGDNIVH